MGTTHADLAWGYVITNAQINALGREARTQRQWARVSVCRRAIEGDRFARELCARARLLGWHTVTVRP